MFFLKLSRYNKYIVLISIIFSTLNNAYCQSNVKNIELLETYGLGNLSGAEYTPDGKWIISFGGIGIVIRDSKTGSVQRIIESDKSIYDISISADSTLIAAASNDSGIVIYSVTTGEYFRTLSWENQISDVLSVSFAPNSRFIVSIYSNTSIRIWDSHTGDLIKILHKGAPKASSFALVRYSPDGRFIASSTVGDSVSIWDSDTGDLIHTLEGHDNKSTTHSLRYSPNSGFIVGASSNKTIKIWETSTGNLTHNLQNAIKTHSVNYSPNGRFFISSSGDDGTIKIWDSETAELIDEFQGHSSTIRSVSYSFDGKSIVSASRNGTIKIWDSETAKLVLYLTGYSEFSRSAKYSPNGQFIASASDDNTVKIWDSNTIKLTNSLQGHSDIVTSISYSPDGHFIASGSFDGTVKVWDSQNGTLIHSLEGHSFWVSSVSYSPDGRFIVSGSWDYSGSQDYTVKVWDSQNGTLIHSLEGHSRNVNSVTFSPDSRYIASGSDDKTIKIWNVQNASLIHSLEGHTDGVKSVSYSSDGRFMVSGSNDKIVKIWDSQGGRLINSLEGHSRGVISVGYSRDNQYIASGSHDTILKIWDANSGTLIHSLQAHSKTISSIDFSPNGQFVLSASWDGTIRNWGLADHSAVFCSTPCRDFYQVIVAPLIFIHSPLAGSAISQDSLSIDLTLDDGGETPDFDVRIDSQQLSVITHKGLQAAADGNDRVILDVVLPEQYRGQTVNLSVEARNSAGSTSQDVFFSFVDFEENSQAPSLVLLQPVNNSELSSIDFEVKLRVKTNTRQTLEYQIYHDGDLLSTETINKGLGAEQEVDGVETVTLPIRVGRRLVDGQETNFTIIATNEHNQDSNPVQLSMVYEPEFNSEERRLIVIGIGTENYQSSDLTPLNYSVDDVEDFVGLLEEQHSRGWYDGLYDKFESYLFTDQNANKDDIIQLLANLETQVTDQDTVLILISGHGINENGRYYIPLYASQSDKLAGTAIRGQDLQSFVINTSARVILMLDTCHAGAAAGVDESNYGRLSSPDAFVSELDKNVRGTTKNTGGAKGEKLILAATTGNNVAVERSDWGNGAFTKALLEGLQGGNSNLSTIAINGDISTGRLTTYISERVAELTGNLQIPAIDQTGTGFSVVKIQE